MNEQSIFLEALERIDPLERELFLQEVCTSLEYRSRIERLLLSHSQSAEFLQEPAVGPNLLASPEILCESVGQTIGRYKLLEQIGEGGMGVVYMAAQQTPVRRTVALKIIKPGMDTRQVIARFEAERQALALMDHPNIARVLDAGATESGRPYFVMELVRGIPLTDYCRNEDLCLEERLNLFIDVCRAVQHAHMRGIIHRDIKPSNVMVTLHDGTPVVKMIDFGVAKAMNQQLTEKTLFTNYSQMIGTPLYMSPEQAEMSGLDVDTRCDVYSLGVLLYELLTEMTPFEKDRMKQVGYDEMRRIIREEEPPRASTRILTHLTTTTQTGTAIKEARRLAMVDMGHALRRDLDWIVAKAMEKNRSRRYQSAQEFSDDVQRYLHGHAVEARPPSVSYRLQKWIRKHRGLTISAALIFCLLLTGTGISGLFAWRAWQAEQVAEAALAQAKTDAAVSKETHQFLVEDLLGQTSPTQMNEQDLTVRELLDRAAERIDGHFEGSPLVEAAIRRTIGNTYLHLSDFEAAFQHLNIAEQLFTTHLGESHPDALACLIELSANETNRLGSRKAIPLWNTAISRAERAAGTNSVHAHIMRGWLAYCLAGTGDFEQAEALIEIATTGLKDQLGPDHPETLECLDSRAEIFFYQKQYDAAEALARRILERRQIVLGDRHPRTLNSLSVLARVLKAQGKNDESLEYHQQALTLRKRTIGPLSPDTILEASGTALALELTRQPVAAQKLYGEALKNGIAAFGHDDFRNLQLMTHLGLLHASQGDFPEAIELLKSVLEARRRTKGSDHEFTLQAVRHLSGVLTEGGFHSDSLKLADEAIEISQRNYGAEDARTIQAMINKMHALQEAGEYAAAIQLGDSLLTLMNERFGSEHRQTLDLMMQLGFTTKKNGRFQRSEQLFRDIMETSKRLHGADNSLALAAANQLAVVLRFQKRYDDALSIAQEVLERRLVVLGDNDAAVHQSLVDVSYCLGDMGRTSEASTMIQRAITVRRKLGNDHHPAVISDLTRLEVLAKQLDKKSQYAAAADAWRSLGRHRSEILGPADPTSLNALAMAQKAEEAADAMQPSAP